jgi:hypothetical protein
MLPEILVLVVHPAYIRNAAVSGTLARPRPMRNPSCDHATSPTFFPKDPVPAQECGSLERNAGIAIDAKRPYWIAIFPAVLQNHNDTLVDKRSQIRVFAAGLLHYRS